MRKLILGFGISIFILSCAEPEPEIYTGRSLEYGLYKASEFDYTGKVTIKEMTDETLEVTIQMDGATSQSGILYPVHLHLGGYDFEDAPIAALLTPVSGNTLTSRSVLGKLADGTVMDFEEMQGFNGHIKIHLASEGPDYEVILTAGNIGANENSALGFDPSKIAVCSKSF